MPGTLATNSGVIPVFGAPPLALDSASPLLARERKRDWSRSFVPIGAQVPPDHESKVAGLGPQALAPSLAEQESSAWKKLLGSILTPAKKAAVTPPWWDADMPFRASLQTWTTSGLHSLTGMSSPPVAHGPTTTLQITMAGWGHYRGSDGKPQVSGPGGILFGSSETLASSLCLPKESQEWTFVRLEISHPYFHQRIAAQAQKLGQVFTIRPDDALTASLMRLVRAEVLKGLSEPPEAERALFDFVLSFEQWAQRRLGGTHEIERLLAETRACILSKLPRAIDVGSLAARFGMSRCRFSHYFREMTGKSPGHFATEVRLQMVEEMLLETREPLKCIADACGFANPNHLCKVFRRLRHITPTMFRQKKR